jgi:hypothetical protein
MLTLLSIWVLLFFLSIVLITLRDDREVMLTEIFCKILFTKKSRYFVLNFLLVFLMMPLTIPFTIYHLWNQ